MTSRLQPTFYIPHGGGPCFFMEDPHGLWTGMEQFLESLPSRMPEPPKAILLVSAHWETDGFALSGAKKPTLLYDYYGFPEHTYQLRYDVPGSPELAARAAQLLQDAGLDAVVDTERGLDHGVFVPLKVVFPNADVPVVAMSLDRGMDPALHLAAGRALAPLRREGVAIIGSGMSFHNMAAMRDQSLRGASEEFDAWLGDAIARPPEARARQLAKWAAEPSGPLAHPREEHLIPLMVAAGASDAEGEVIYREALMGNIVSGYRFA